VKIMRPCVVAETLPRMKDFVFRCSSHRGEIGEVADPVIIIRDNSGNLGLLEHELRDENGVRIAGFAPGESAAIVAIPINQCGMKVIFRKRHR